MEGRGQRRIGEVTVSLCRRQKKNRQRGDSRLTAPPPARVTELQWLYRGMREEGGRKGGETEEYDFGPDWSLQHDYLGFSQGITGWQGQRVTIRVQLLHVLIWRTSLCLDRKNALRACLCVCVWIYLTVLIKSLLLITEFVFSPGSMLMWRGVTQYGISP